MDESTRPAVKKGDRIEVTYADKQFEVIVIDPDGIRAWTTIIWIWVQNG